MISRRTRSFPIGVTPGAPTLVGAWLVGLAVARLTGAAAVVLLLVACFVAMAAAAISGWWRLRSVDLVGIVGPSVTTAGDVVDVLVDHTDRHSSDSRFHPVGGPPVTIRFLGSEQHLEHDPPTAIGLTIDDAGIIDEIDVVIESAGIAGLVKWRRRQRVTIDPLHVAPRPSGPILPVDHAATVTDGTSASGNGPRIGDLDGARPWRPGEGEQSIHWPSTLRAGEIIAHDRTTSAESRWTVPLDSEPDRLRWTLHEGLRAGHEIVLVDDSDPTAADVIPVRTNDDAARWSAIAAKRALAGLAESQQATAPFWRRPLTITRSSRSPSHCEGIAAHARLLTGLAGLVSIWMLLGALRGTITEYALVSIGIAIATAASLRYAGGHRPWWARGIIVFIAAAALGRIAVQSSGIGGLLEALRGPLPDLLMLLVVLHGAEIADRRTNRVHLAITGVIVAYSTGLRIDGMVGWWLLAWGATTIAAFCAMETPVRLPWGRVGPDARRPGSFRRATVWTTAGAACTIGIAAFVPIPDGPASLGLPALSDDNASSVDDDGALVGPDGSPAQPNFTGDPGRGSLGQAGGYPGFSDTLDTSVRGDLGDEVVMRVRAPEPAFWRGQTFTEFDGRSWRVTEEVGRRIDGPQIRLDPTIGDLPDRGVPSEEFVQTFHVESDLPNVIFAASTPTTVIFDGSVFARSDSALHADRTLAEGTVYSVVSRRIDVTAENLRSQGDVSTMFAPVADEPEIAVFLDIPESTTDRTLALAETLLVEGSTYDTVRAYEAWMAANTEYDLDSPVPGGDAVDDFLFDSQRGFCEQIASSLVVMLRSQGVPARLATGYIPGERDQISGVFEVRASDAHAWVEVWFPATGWEAFDPTASVPLAGDAERSTVGTDAASAIIDGVTSRPVEVGIFVLLVSGIVGALRWLSEFRRRRTRGAWGLLHDRFMALAPDAVTAPQAARHLVELLGPDTFGPHVVAEILDGVVFDPDHVADDDERRRVAADIAGLEREVKAVEADLRRSRRRAPTSA